jgi:hypothetical protein
MASTLQSSLRRWLVALTVALVLMFASVYASVAFQSLTGVSLTTPVYACQHAGGGGC